MSACKMMTFKTNLNVLLKEGLKIIESQMPFKVPMKRNLVFRFFQYFKSLNTKTCLAFQKIETPAIELKKKTGIGAQFKANSACAVREFNDVTTGYILRRRLSALYF